VGRVAGTEVPAGTVGVAAEMFGRYRLDAMLGRGGMGEVYRAFDTQKGRHVAVKRLRRDLAADATIQRLFRNESERTARLAEPHVIPIHDYGEINGQLFLEMRLVDGADLGTHLARYGPLPPRLAVAIISQVASALDAAHAAGMAHRDVKPSNILVSGLAHGVPFAYLVDFGIAQLAPEAGGTAATHRGGLLGTLAYMAPERFEGAPTGGGARPFDRGSADVYALACVTYECLTARKPFDGEPIALMWAHLNSPPPRPSAIRRGLPAALDAVIARGMAKDPADRHPGAGAFAAAAREAVGQETDPLVRGPAPPDLAPPDLATTTTVGPTDATSTGLVPGQGPRVVEPPAAPKVRLSRRAVLVGGAALVGLTGAGTLAARFAGLGGSGGKVLWSAPTGGQVLARPTAAGTAVFAASNDGALYAFGAADGALRWRFPTGAALGSTPEVLGGVAYLGSDDGTLYAIDTATHVARWATRLGNIVHSPRAAGGVVYVGCADAKVYALDVLDHRIRWTAAGGNDMHQVVLAGDTVFVGSSDTFLYALNGVDGEQRWRFGTAGAVSGAPAVTGSAVLTGSTDGRLYSLAPADGTLQWQVDGVAPAAVPVVLGATVFVAADNGLEALDLASGDRRWRFDVPGSVHTPAVAGETVYVGAADNKLYALDAATGSQRWSVTLGGPVFAAAVADNTVYAGAGDNRLYAVSV
jgi:outer membrane protein assembly factor BamB